MANMILTTMILTITLMLFRYVCLFHYNIMKTRPSNNIDYGYTLGDTVLTNTHNLCFGATITKICKPLHTPALLYKSGVQGGIHFTDMFS